MVIDANDTTTDQAIRQVLGFVRQHAIRVLNVAGPRSRKQPEINDFVRGVVEAVLRSTTGAEADRAVLTPQKGRLCCRVRSPVDRSLMTGTVQDPSHPVVDPG